MMTELREDVRCRNCGAYAPEELEEVATLLDQLLGVTDNYPDDHDRISLVVMKLTEAWKKV